MTLNLYKVVIREYNRDKEDKFKNIIEKFYAINNGGKLDRDKVRSLFYLLIYSS